MEVEGEDDVAADGNVDNVDDAVIDDVLAVITHSSMLSGANSAKFH